MTARNPEDRAVMDRIRAKLYAVNSYYAYQDFKQANPEGQRYSQKGEPLPYRPYTLSPLTQEARECYHLAFGIIWPEEAESQIKGYLTRLRLSGELDTILEWERTSPGRLKKNPWIRDAQGGNAL